MEAKQRW